jgi:hypothetical protein
MSPADDESLLEESSFPPDEEALDEPPELEAGVLNDPVPASGGVPDAPAPEPVEAAGAVKTDANNIIFTAR